MPRSWAWIAYQLAVIAALTLFVLTLIEIVK